MRVKITPQLLKIHLSPLEKSSRVSEGDVLTDLGWLTPTWSVDTDPRLVLHANS